jgi:hypothetical protein
MRRTNKFLLYYAILCSRFDRASSFKVLYIPVYIGCCSVPRHDVGREAHARVRIVDSKYHVSLETFWLSMLLPLSKCAR